MKIVLTGGNGFLGQNLLKNEIFKNALAIGREQPKDHQNFKKTSFLNSSDLRNIIEHADIVVHAAGRAHVMNDKAKSSLDEFRRVNTEMTLNLAEQAGKGGVRRFIFISSIKVLGENTVPDRAFKFSDKFNPQDPYSISKMEAEIGLKKIGKRYNMEIVIIRPPLIYGANVKGNFEKLLKLCRLGLPLPFGAFRNKRSMISVENLIDFIIVCMTSENAKNRTFLVSDDYDVSTPELLMMLSIALGRQMYIFKVPEVLLSFMFKLLKKSAEYERLSESMQVDIQYSKSKLSWEPPFKMADCFTKNFRGR